jgi:glycosyltransferase involved in cell wall biosynthesis
MPLEKIVIARWLARVADEIGESCHYIPNGLDFMKFGCDLPPAARWPRHLAMLFNEEATWKGSADGLAAVCQVKEKHPDLEADFFGVFDRPKTLPSWITYHKRPSQEELRMIYNRAAIFIAPSHSEGWGLPPSEAMICGAAVVATDIGGHREFCKAHDTAYLVPPKSPGKLAEAITVLIKDQNLRLEIAKKGCENIQQFTWCAATDSMERVLSGGRRRIDGLSSISEQSN